MTPREARETRGIQQGWVARQMGISQAYLSRLESGERRWAGDLAERFALAIGFPLTLISFAQSATPHVSICHAVYSSTATEAPSGSLERRDAPCECVDTREPSNGR